MQYIQSKDNNLIKETKKLKEKKFRNERKQFLIEGFRFVSEALDSGFEVPLVFIDENENDRWASFRMEEKLQSITKVCRLSPGVLKTISGTETPQGISAVVNFKYITPSYKKGMYILVDKVQDPGNLGTIIRTAHASGALGVILSEGTVDLYNEKTLRSTMGSIFHLPLIEDKNYETVNSLKKEGFKLIASSLDCNSDFYKLDLKERIIIAVGNEGSGISEDVLKFSDYKVKIPMPGGAESLNVAVAAGVMMYEVVRQNLMDNGQ